MFDWLKKMMAKIFSCWQPDENVFWTQEDIALLADVDDSNVLYETAAEF